MHGGNTILAKILHTEQETKNSISYRVQNDFFDFREIAKKCNDLLHAKSFAL